MTRKKIVVAVKKCARCEKDHEPMCFLPFKRPVQPPNQNVTHWASCPTTGEPILLSVEAVKSPAKRHKL